jgi:hypothetical protein
MLVKVSYVTKYELFSNSVVLCHESLALFCPRQQMAGYFYSRCIVRCNQMIEEHVSLLRICQISSEASVAV